MKERENPPQSSMHKEQGGTCGIKQPQVALPHIAIVLLVIFILQVGCVKDSTVLSNKKPVFVKATAVEIGELVKTLHYTGTVMPWRKANIVPEIAGRIARIHHKQGDYVKKGQLMAELDAKALQLRLNQAEAARDAAKAVHKNARLNYSRLKRLHEKAAVSQLQLEKAELMLESLKTQEKSAQAAVNILKYNLENSAMHAPFKGIVTARNLEEGDIVNPMIGIVPPIMTLMDLEKVKIAIELPPGDIEKIAKGQVCKISISTQQETFTGKVYSINLAADPVTRTFKVEVEVENPGTKIKGGVFAGVEIEIYRRPNTLILPVSALIVERNVSYVVLYNNGVAKYRNVKVGERNHRYFEIIEGLKEKELIIIEGNYDLKEKTPVTLQGDNI
ncbi:MAG: efflux RND transporter periplasmic adaptor subunit [bacterium]|nr:efflux RND transporter periplasmic adaptor subunit [bacterium]